MPSRQNPVRPSLICLAVLAGLTILCACALFGGSDEGTPVPCATATAECEARLTIGGGLYLRYYRSHPIDRRNPQITRLLVIVHGSGRAADYNFETGLLLTRNTGHREDTLVIAPFFQTIDDGPAQDEAYWTSSGWKKGHLSVEDGLRPQRVSSYAVMDIFLREVALEGRFPNLEAVVVAGHSAGGQYAHRYAAGGRAEPELPAPVRYVVANPSSYLYLGLERKTEIALDEFEVPSTAECSGYNIWHYGLEGLNTYMNGLSEAQIIANLTARDIFIMVGTADTGSDQLDVSCGAILQGTNRYIRGLVLINYMDALWPGHHHSRHVVLGIAHSSRGMFGSEKGVVALFGELQPAAVATAMLAPYSPLVGP